MKFRPQHALITPPRLAALLLAVASCLLNAVQAAEAPPEDTAKETATETSKPADSKEPAPSAEVFIPTEEISEDFAVAFPVDI